MFAYIDHSNNPMIKYHFPNLKIIPTILYIYIYIYIYMLINYHIPIDHPSPCILCSGEAQGLLGVDLLQVPENRTTVESKILQSLLAKVWSSHSYRL